MDIETEEFYFGSSKSKKSGKSEETNESYIKLLRRGWTIVLVLAAIFFIIATALSLGLVNLEVFTLISFVLSGALVGLYYGTWNDMIFHFPDKNKPECRNEFARTNTLWIHLVSGSFAGVAAFLLINNLACVDLLKHPECLSWPHLVLFLIVLGGFTGLIPRWLWFFASRGGPGDYPKN